MSEKPSDITQLPPPPDEIVPPIDPNPPEGPQIGPPVDVVPIPERTDPPRVFEEEPEKEEEFEVPD